jgi:hypothetical protein
VNFDSISQWGLNRYWQNGAYGPNTGWFGSYAYIYMNIGGEEIQDGAVVAQYAILESPWSDDMELAYCVTKYYSYQSYPAYNEIDTKNYVFDYQGGRDGPAYTAAPSKDPNTGNTIPQAPISVTFKN